MGTRTNFYKNPSISYNKHFSLSSVLQNLRGQASLQFSFSSFEIYLHLNLVIYPFNFRNLQLTTSLPVMFPPISMRKSPARNVAGIRAHREPSKLNLKRMISLCHIAITSKREGKYSYVLLVLSLIFIATASATFPVHLSPMGIHSLLICS